MVTNVQPPLPSACAPHHPVACTFLLSRLLSNTALMTIADLTNNGSIYDDAFITKGSFIFVDNHMIRPRDTSEPLVSSIHALSISHLYQRVPE